MVPVWAQNLGISMYGLAWRRERLGGRFEQYVREFRERENWPAERMKDYVDEQLREVLSRAFADVPYYQEKWKENPAILDGFRKFTISDLQNFPIVPKNHLRADPWAFVSRKARRSERLHKYYSSGTTGTPITAICTADGHRRFIAAREARSLAWAGSSIRKSRSMIGGRLVVPKGISEPPFHRYNSAEKQVYFSAYHISPANAVHYVSALNVHRPSLFTGYAYSHFLLGKIMLEQNLALDYQPKALVLGSEKLTPEMKETIAGAFGARAYEEYGCVENCMLATECEHGRLHANPDFGIIEILDEQGQRAEKGQIGRIVCTSLLNEAQPLIRYEIGDLGAWSEETCPCGRNHSPVLKEIVGRLEDVVIGPDGRQLVRFHGIFIGLPSVLEGQVIQEAVDQFVVRVVTLANFGEREVRAITNRFHERLGNVTVQVEQVSTIPRTERGKFRAVISKVKKSA